VSGAGIDLLEIERLERALERHPRLTQRLFTDAEREYAASRARPGRHLAARFCVKEAVTKALGLSHLAPRDIEVLAGGEDVGLRLHGAAWRRARELGVDVRISLTHTRDLAAAVATLGALADAEARP
jgi:holo-[acyl-carrier protein] synthase